MKNVQCDHCGKALLSKVDVNNLHWCKECYNIDFQKIIDVGVHEISPMPLREDYTAWGKLKNILLIRTIPKKSSSAKEIVPVAESPTITQSTVIESKVCPAYYGTSACVCGKHNQQKFMKAFR